MKYRIMTALFALLLLPRLAYASVRTSLGTDNNIIINGTAEPYESVTVVLINNTIVDEADRNNAESVIKAYKKIIEDGNIISTKQIKHYAQVKADKNGQYSVDFSLVGSDKGEYTVYVNNGDNCYVAYASNDYRIQLINSIKTGEIETADAISDNISYISSLSDIYKNITNTNKVADFAEASIKNIDTENKENAISQLMKILDEAVIAQGVIEGKVSDFDEVFLNVSETDRVKTLKDNVTAEGRKQIITNIKGADINTIDKFRKEFQKQTALGAINYNENQTAENILGVITGNNDVLELNLKEFLLLKSSNQALAAKRLSEAKCGTVAEAQTKLDSIVSEINKTARAETGGGTGSGTGSGGKSTVASGAALAGSTSIPSALEGRDLFSDMQGYEWAKNAIKKLVDYKIISGYEDNTFKPQNNISRAEFIKMVTAAFSDENLSEKESVFYDVANDAWYCRYVMTAFENNFAKGTDDNRFLPLENITRQDMAVILYNAAKQFGIISGDTDELFSDDTEISDYAKEAIYCLKSNKLINGTGNNEFAPKSYATRAEAAQILYSLITATERQEV